MELAGHSAAGWEESGAGGSVVEDPTCAIQSVPLGREVRHYGTHGTGSKGDDEGGVYSQLTYNKRLTHKQVCWHRPCSKGIDFLYLGAYYG